MSYDISYRQNVVTVRSACARDDREEFNARLSTIDGHILLHFARSKSGTNWGSDGVSYDVQLHAGAPIRHKSGVGPRKWNDALSVVRACPTCRAHEVHI